METVLVKGWTKDDSHKDGVVINKADFVEGVHELFSAPAKPEQKNEFLNRKADEIIAEIAALNDEELAAALADEQSAKNRKGVTEAIEAEIAERAKGE